MGSDFVTINVSETLFKLSVLDEAAFATIESSPSIPKEATESLLIWLI